MQILDDQLAAVGVEIVNHVPGLGHNFTPVVLSRMAQINVQHAAVLGLPVGPYVEMTSAGGGEETRVNTLDHGLDRSFVRQILAEYFGFVGGRAVQHVNDEIAAILGHLGQDDIGGPVPVPENLNIPGGVRAQLVKAHVRRILTHQGVVQPAVVVEKRNLEVAGSRQHISQRLAGVDIEEMDLGFVSAAAANSVGQQAAIGAHSANVHAHAAVGAHGMRVHQDLVLSAAALTHVNDEQVLGGAPPAEKI